jgi:hypothetical protein
VSDAGFPDSDVLEASGPDRRLQDAERVFFHRAPAEALAAFADIRAMADPAGELAARATWLHGAALGALGRYSDALAVLLPVTEQGEVALPVRYVSLAASTAASVYRQMDRYAHAGALDSSAARKAEAAGARDALFDARLGAAADAVGLRQHAIADRLLVQAAAVLPADDWRCLVRLEWVTTEVRLLGGEPKSAIASARRALTESERAGAPRHVAKSALFLGAALLSRPAGADRREALLHLTRAAALAEGIGALPLVWVSRALVGAVLAPSEPDRSSASLTAARGAVAAIGAGLSEADRAVWLTRPDIAALGLR